MTRLGWEVDFLSLALPFVKDKKRAGSDQAEVCGVVPFEFVAEIPHGKNGEDDEGDDFLDRFQLCRGEFVGADAVGGHLETIFEEGDAPAGEDYFPERFVTIFQVAVSREGHEDI